MMDDGAERVSLFCTPPSLLVSFRCYEISPVCADLQEQIMKCYRENAGKTLLCSNIASLYMQCVNSAKQVSVSETLPVCF